MIDPIISSSLTPRQLELKSMLDAKVELYNSPDFIHSDPIKIPHQFSQLQDIEIMGFWVAMLAWGQRVTIINKAQELIELMEGRPYEFILNHREEDRKRFLNFKHRTFQSTDTLYFLDFFQRYYNEYESLESAFTHTLKLDDEHIGLALEGFHNMFFDHPNAPARTRKHVATPVRKSTCKRLNMFLRWMVRNDNQGVDFGVWKGIKSAQLLIPFDVHVERVARRLGLISRKQSDWLTVCELTQYLKQFDPVDPVKYDFALFGMGVMDKSNLPLSKSSVKKK